jgi:hypothetical protein
MVRYRPANTQRMQCRRGSKLFRQAAEKDKPARARIYACVKETKQREIVQDKAAGISIMGQHAPQPSVLL